MPDNQYALGMSANFPDARIRFRISNCRQSQAIKLACILAIAATCDCPIASKSLLAADAESIYKDIAPSIVMIASKNEDEKTVSQGTGFVVDPSHVVYASPMIHLWLSFALNNETDGPGQQKALVLTNFHVIESSVSIELAFSNGVKGIAIRVLAEDPKTDLALLWCVFPKTANITSLKLSSERPQVGSVVHAIGCPKGQAFLISSGIISGFSTATEEQVECILHSVPISPGSSGSPLVNTRGEVVGVASASIQGGQNLNVAAFASDALKLSSGVDHGRAVPAGRSIKTALKNVLSEVRSRIYDEEIDGTARDALEAILRPFADQDHEKVDVSIRELLEIKDAIPNDMVHIYDFLMGQLFYRSTEIEVGPKIEQAMRSPEAMEGIFAAYRSSLSHALASHHFARSIKAKPDFVPAVHAQVTQFAMEGKYQEAYDNADILTRLMPYCFEAFFMKGNALVGLEKYAEAKIAFARAHHLDPRNQTLLFHYGNVLRDLNEYEDSASVFLAAAREGRDLEPLAYFSAAQSFQKAQRYRKAIEAYEQAITLDSNKFITESARQLIRFCEEKLSN